MPSSLASALAVTAAIVLAAGGSSAFAQSIGLPPAPAPVADRATVRLAPGLAPVADFSQVIAEAALPTVPEGFRPLFNGTDLSGWHVSRTSRHGVTPEFRVFQGILLGTQQPVGRGGLLVSNESFRDFELYLEVRSDWGNDSGVFFRTTENGAGYQVTMDSLPCGSIGRLIGEGGVQISATAGPLAPAAASVPPRITISR